MFSLLKSELRFECRIDCILSGNLSPLVALVAKVIRLRKICMPMDCLAEASVCRACRRNKSNAGVRWCNEQLTCQDCARGFVTANKSRKAVQDSPAVFFYSILGQPDVRTCCVWRTREKYRRGPDARESGYSINRGKGRGGMMQQQVMKQKMRLVKYIDQQQHKTCKI